MREEEEDALDVLLSSSIIIIIIYKQQQHRGHVDDTDVIMLCVWMRVEASVFMSPSSILLPLSRMHVCLH